MKDKITWKPSKFTIRTTKDGVVVFENGLKKTFVKGEVLFINGRRSYFAVRERKSWDADYWVIDHLPSGFSVGRRWPDKKTAKRATMDLLKIKQANWRYKNKEEVCGDQKLIIETLVKSIISKFN